MPSHTKKERAKKQKRRFSPLSPPKSIKPSLLEATADKIFKRKKKRTVDAVTGSPPKKRRKKK